MNTRIKNQKTSSGSRQAIAATTIAFFSTLLSLPVSAALNVPAVPLQVGTPLAPNIMLILDDSGSMVWDFMPGPFNSSSVPSVSPDNIRLEAYPRNTLYYNPSISYEPWKTADGSYVSGGTTLASVWGNTTLASGATNISNRTNTFYQPKSDGLDLSKTASYYRFQVLSNGEIYRAEYGTSSQFPGAQTFTPISVDNLSGDTGEWLRYNFALPANASDLNVTLSGGGGNGNGDADLYVRIGSAPALNNYDCRSWATGNDENCSFSSPSQGTYHVGIYGYAKFKKAELTVTYKVGSDSCGATGTGNAWRNCTRTTPEFIDNDGTSQQRSETQEKTNFATWYSYHRTRMKAAKAGVSAAFSDLNGDNYRVGFTTIWGPNAASRNPEFLLNVGSNNGLFSDNNGSTNRTTWFSRLQGAEATNGTPLKDALDRMGRYYSDGLSARSGTAGPYGPEANPLACRKNFSILTTDGYWNSNSVDPGNADNSNGATYFRPDGTSELSYTAAAPYSDGHSGTLADVAMKFWKTDLMPNLDNIVPASTANPAFWQHMVTFGISLGLSGTLPQKTVQDVLDAGANGFAWPNPNDDENDERIDDLLHAAVNGHGAFAAATNPAEFTNALRAALASIAEQTSSGSNLAVNSSSINGSTQSYSASFVAGLWTGDVQAYGIDDSGVVRPPVWTASAGIPTTGRKVLTYGGTNGSAVTPATFPTADQTTVLTQPIADYIKGRRTGEGTTYRARNTLFGDIVNSSPVYVESGSSKTVYVGANDGMLHAIDATNGTEVFAYVPGLVNMGRLKELSRRIDFVHQYFVDGPLVVSTELQTPGERRLVGTLGRGGKGVFGMNVTNPQSFSSTGQSWEYSGGADMGQVLGKPLIAKLNVGGTTTNVAIVPNGINSTNDKAVLFVINLETGVLIQKIATNNEAANGLSIPTGLDADSDGVLDMVYAGDLQGNVWRFDLTSASVASWSAAKLFTATSPADTTVRQPITGGVTIAYNPVTYDPWVFFGTGRYIVETDPADLSVQSWYGIRDNGTAVAGRAALKDRDIILGGQIGGRPVRAFEKAVSGDMVNSDGWVVDLKAPPAPGTAKGERMIGDQFVVAGSTLVATSIIPESAGCATTGSGFLNFIDAFTGGAVGSPLVDANSDGNFDNDDGLTSDDGNGGTEHNEIGSISLGDGLITDVLTLLNGSGGGQFCANGTSGPNCVATKWPPGFGRVSWREILKD